LCRRTSCDGAAGDIYNVQFKCSACKVNFGVGAEVVRAVEVHLGAGADVQVADAAGAWPRLTAEAWDTGAAAVRVRGCPLMEMAPTLPALTHFEVGGGDGALARM